MITRNVKLFFKFILFLWLAAIAMRLAFLAWQWDSISTSTWGTILKAFYIGVRFDGRLSAILALPLGIFLFTPFLGKKFGKTRGAVLIFYTALMAIYILGYIVDMAHYQYLQLRVNFAAVELLEEAEAAGMVWQTYPVVRLALMILVLTAISFFIIKKLFSSWKYEQAKMRYHVLSAFVTLFGFALLIYGQYSINFFPLRWSEAYFSGYNDITALGLNPYLNVIDTIPKNARAADNTDAARGAYPIASKYLGINSTDESTTPLRYDRFIEARSAGKPNVVVIVIESMTTHKSTFMFDELDTTTYLKELASKSVYFPNYYAPARTTAKAMFSVITGVPDVTKAFSSSSRDSSVIDQHTVWGDFDGYKKLYMLGGNANWANIRGVMTNNIPGIKVYEEGYWESPRMDVWGISDMDLLQEANQILAKEAAPFISVIQLASFHRPFTVPDGIEGMDYTQLDEERLKHYGLVPEEYLSMKFCDLAIKRFFESAERESYFENTIFVVTGDHGISERVPAAGANYQRLQLNEYQIPLIIYYPKQFDEGMIKYETGSHVDLFPTVASLAGIGYQNTTMGRDLFDPQFGEDRFTFIYRTSNAPVILNGEYALSDNGNGTFSLYKRTPNMITEDWQPVDESDDDLLKSELTALNKSLFETATYMLGHNKKADAERAKLER